MENIRLKVKICLKSFFSFKKELLVFFIISFLCVFMFSTYIYITKSNELSSRNSTVVMYGDYEVMFSGLNNQQIELLMDDENIKDMYISKEINTNDVSNTEQDCTDENISIYYTDEYDCLKCMCNFDKGGFPKNKNEIALEYNYLIKNGINSKHCIGNSIDIMGNKYNISGVFTLKNNEEKKYSSVAFLNDNKHDVTNYLSNVYVNLKCSTEKSFVNDLERIIEKLNKIENISVTYNEPMIYEKGLNKEGLYKVNNQKSIEFSICLICIIFIIITIYNITNICLSKWIQIMSVYKLIGVSMKFIRTIIAIIFMFFIVLSDILAIIFSKLVVLNLKSIINQRLNIDISYVTNINLRNILFFIVVELCMVYVFCIVFMRKLNMLSSIEIVLMDNSEKINSEVLCKESLFTGRGLNVLLYAIRNVMLKKIRNIVLALIMGMSVVLIFILQIQINEQMEHEDGNNNYQYMFNVPDYWYFIDQNQDEARTKCISDYEKLIKILKKNGLEIYMYRTSERDYFMDSETAGDEYLDMIKKIDLPLYYSLKSGRANTGLVIMGYSESMMQEFMNINGMSNIELGDNDCIMLSRTVNMNGMKSAKINPPEDITISLDIEENEHYEKRYTFKVKESVDKLLLYPNAIGNYPCIIINEDNFLNLFTTYNKEYTINSFYVKTIPDEVLEQIDEILNESDISIVNNYIVNQESNNNYVRRIVMFTVIFILCVIGLISNLLLVKSFDIHTRKKEFAVMYSLGICKKIQFRLLLYEVIIDFIIGIILGVICTNICIYFFIANNILIWGKISINMIKVSIVFVATILVGLSIVIMHRVSNIKIPKDLQQ